MPTLRTAVEVAEEKGHYGIHAMLQDCVAVSGRIGCFQEFAILGFHLVSVACDGGLEIWFWPFCEVLQAPARKFG